MSWRSRRSRSPRFKRRPSLATESADRHADTVSSSPSKFDQLIELIKTQNGLISDQSKASNAQKEEIKAELRAQLHTMDKHTSMLSALGKDATRDDRPLDGKEWNNDQAWGALDKESLAKIKVMVDEWRDLMQISLVFIALFLTVVTAFISPIIQLFTTPSNTASSSTDSMKPLPSVPLQLVALFYYMALITSILNSVLCVLGIQWGVRLIATPLGRTNLERALARERRMLSAKGKMRSLMGVLIWTLLLSIGFFVLGFLIQLWDLAFSFASSAPILVIGGVFATGLTLVILGIIMVTTLHAALNDNSPFESPLSNAMKPLLQWIHQRVRRQGHDKSETDTEKNENSGSNGTEDAEDVTTLIQWKKDDRADIIALKTYAKLVLNTHELEVLERAVPSFEYAQWYLAGDSLLPVFHAVRERFLATDASFRVKETVHSQLLYLTEWGGWKDRRGFWRYDLKANDFTRWCQAQCSELINSSGGYQRAFVPPFTFFTSLEEDNMDLRNHAFGPTEACVANILCTFDADRELGDRGDLFESAIEVCKNLLSAGRTDDVNTILSRVDRTSVLRSIIRNPDMWWWDQVHELVAFITKGKEIEILAEMSPFFSNLPDMSAVSHPAIPVFACEFLEHIGSRPDFTTPPSLDLSPVLTLIDQNTLFERYSETLIYYLCRGGLDNLSDLHPASKLWEYCRDMHSDHGTSEEVVAFYQDYTCCFIPLPALSNEECQDLAHNICALMTRPDNTLCPVKDFKRPISELLALDDEQRNTAVEQILSDLPRADFIAFLIKKTRLPWARMQDLVLPIAQGHEMEILTIMSDPDRFSFRSHHAVIAFLDFLSCLRLSLPPDFTVPPPFSLSEVLYYVVRHKCERQNWRQHSDAIIFYVENGASCEIDDIAHFCHLCTAGTHSMKKWDDDERTSAHTRERAAFHLRTLKARAAQDPDLAERLRPFFPEGYGVPPLDVTDEIRPSREKTSWTFAFLKWRDALRKSPRRTMLLDDEQDIELGTTGGIDTSEESVEDGS
ncbi:hypothetical protein SISNIDRAFT_469798 [Sistotremastrum niveocremeum HHB9708]|uniref:DUF6535 domain-containing protein n=1 Tax=Sistotremastrum niveocremeum HHB9708 TaxID=1314777 RepID=A0A164PNV2_9AGAM|nr:hypothetical protein SISNIDRAFT_469798 [Sistotremastrum niveocremeum HHB9708]